MCSFKPPQQRGKACAPPTTTIFAPRRGGFCRGASASCRNAQIRDHRAQEAVKTPKIRNSPRIRAGTASHNNEETCPVVLKRNRSRCHCTLFIKRESKRKTRLVLEKTIPAMMVNSQRLKPQSLVLNQDPSALYCFGVFQIAMLHQDFVASPLMKSAIALVTATDLCLPPVQPMAMTRFERPSL